MADVTDFTDATWFDRAGNFHSDALKVIERFTPMGRDAIRYEATITDPQVFTRPWKISMPLYRRLEPNAQLMEFRCVEMVEETMYGHLRKEPTGQALGRQDHERGHHAQDPAGRGSFRTLHLRQPAAGEIRECGRRCVR